MKKNSQKNKNMKNPKKVCKINLNISNLLKKRSPFKKK